MSIDRVIIKNFRALKSADVLFKSGANVIVGDNEAGKSTLLEAINLALKGQLNRRPASYELHPFLFNREVVRDFIQSHKDGNPSPPPEILIEVYFTPNDANAAFRGGWNSLRDDQASGVYLKIKLDEENFSEEFRAYVSNADALNEIPIEYYTIEWRSFASGPQLKPQAIPIKAALIDPSSISNTYAANKYVVEIVRDYLSKAERVDLALSYRSMRETFQSDERISAINASLASQTGTVTDKTLSVAMDVTTRASWETGVLPHLDDIPLTLTGKGEQNSIKIKLAIAAAEGCDLFLMEEPENHLTHTNLGRLISHIQSTCEEKQLIITTHSSFVLNKLGLDRVIMFNRETGITLDDLPADTKSYFQRLPGHDTLRMILATRTILVEGPSDELIVQKGFRQQHSVLPLQAGVELMSVGTSFKRYLDIAARLGSVVSIARDNDGDSTAKKALFSDYADDDNISVFIDADDAAKTLEPQLIKANGRDKLNTMLGETFADDESLLKHMTGNKTSVALDLFEHEDRLEIPEYLQNAIG